MDLVELEKPAILFPTPNQSEQLYLADYLLDKNYFVIGNEAQHLNILVKQIDKTKPFSTSHKTQDAISKISSLLLQ